MRAGKHGIQWQPHVGHRDVGLMDGAQRRLAEDRPAVVAGQLLRYEETAHLAVMLGVGLRISAVAGSAMMLLMYVAEWPFAAGTGSTNPLVDYHIIYALALIVVAVLAAGDTWGLGAWWKSLPIVQKYRWLV